MGNSLDCTAAEAIVAVGSGRIYTYDSGAWNCSGLTVIQDGGSCDFPFMYIQDGKPNRVFSECVSFNDALPPGYDGVLEDDISSFWCSKNSTLYASNGTLGYGHCACEIEPEASTEEDMTWLLGVLFSILSSICTTVGTLMQKIAHRINDAKPEGEKAKEIGGILFSPAWFCAFLLMVLLPLPFDFIALALAAQSLLVVFAGLTIALNLFMAQVMLGEKPDRVEIIATVIILFGIIIATISGQKQDANFDACDLLLRYGEADFLVGVTSLSVLIGAALYLIHYAKPTPMLLRLKPSLFAFCAGGFGGIGNIVFKATGELAQAGLSTSGRSSGAWSTIHPYYHIVLIIIFATLQIMHINQGLRRYDAVLYVPLYNCMYIILSGSMGALTYREFDNYTLTQYIMFPSGVAITLVGILVMTLKEPDSRFTEGKIAPHPISSTEVKEPEPVKQ